MIDFEVKTVIDRPVSEVFAYVTDPFRLATWQTNTVAAEQLDDAPRDAVAPARGPSRTGRTRARLDRGGN